MDDAKKKARNARDRARRAAKKTPTKPALDLGKETPTLKEMEELAAEVRKNFTGVGFKQQVLDMLVRERRNVILRVLGLVDRGYGSQNSELGNLVTKASTRWIKTLLSQEKPTLTEKELQHIRTKFRQYFHWAFQRNLDTLAREAARAEAAAQFEKLTGRKVSRKDL